MVMASGRGSVMGSIQGDRGDGSGRGNSVDGSASSLSVADALRHSEQRYRHLVETMPYGMQEVDLEGRVVFANRALGKILGHPHERLIGTHVWELQVEPDRRDELRRYVEHLVEVQPPPKPYRAASETGDGRHIQIQVDWDYKRDADGNLVGFVAVVTDITQAENNRQALQAAHDHLEERVARRTRQLADANLQLEDEVRQRREAEMHQRQAHEFLQSVVDAISAHVAVLNSKGRIVLVNRAWRRFAAENDLNNADCCIGENYLDVARNAEGDYSAEGPEAAEGIRQVINHQRDTFYLEYPCHSPNEKRWFQMRASRFTHGDQSWVIVAHENVTELKEQAEALRRSEQRFRVVFERSPLGMGMGARDGRMIDANPALCQMVGYSRDELRGMTVEQLTHPDDRAMDREAKQTVEEQKQDHYYLEKRYVHKEGHDIWVRVTATAIRTDDGAFNYGLALVEDITERKRTEEALRRAEHMASIGTLAAGIAHEVNNPLHGIVLYSEAARLMKGDSDDARDELLVKIQQEAMRCGRLVRSVLQFSRREPSHKWPCHVGQLLGKACDLARQLAEGYDVTVDLSVPDDLPRLSVNPTEIEQVVVNILNNAAEASPPGETVRVVASREGDRLGIRIEDRGCGMEPEQTKRIFDPFFTTRQKSGGTGLGLSIAYSIVREHGGTIEVQSSPGQGTTFQIWLPTPSSGV